MNERSRPNTPVKLTDAWILACLLVFIAIGVNHLLTHDPDPLKPFLVAGVLVSRNPAVMAIRWSSGQHNVMLVMSWVWVAIIWLSVFCASGIAEVHRVLHSRAR